MSSTFPGENPKIIVTVSKYSHEHIVDQAPGLVVSEDVEEVVCIETIKNPG